MSKKTQAWLAESSGHQFRGSNTKPMKDLTFRRITRKEAAKATKNPTPGTQSGTGTIGYWV